VTVVTGGQSAKSPRVPVPRAPDTDGGVAWKEKLPGNPLSFEGVYNLNAAVDVIAAQGRAALGGIEWQTPAPLVAKGGSRIFFSSPRCPQSPRFAPNSQAFGGKRPEADVDPHFLRPSRHYLPH